MLFLWRAFYTCIKLIIQFDIAMPGQIRRRVLFQILPAHAEARYHKSQWSETAVMCMVRHAACNTYESAFKRSMLL
jgi:hypothetical protein